MVGEKYILNKNNFRDLEMIFYNNNQFLFPAIIQVFPMIFINKLIEKEN